MYANTGHHASWAYSSEDFHSVDDYIVQSLSSDSDSEQELHDVEELLYSHIHYEPNYLCTTGTVDDLSSSDVHVTHLNDGVLDGLDISAASNIEVQQKEVAEIASCSISLFSPQLKRKSKSRETGDSDNETKTKFKKVDAAGCALRSTVEGSASLLNSPDNSASKEITEVWKQDIRQPTGQHLAKKERKAKQKSSSVSPAAVAVVTDSWIVLDSSSGSSSDAYCCDLSSEELSSNDADDIKLSNINVVVPDMSDVDALADVLNGLSGMFLLSVKAAVDQF